MELWQNLPFFSILIPLASAAFTSIMPGRFARRTAAGVITVVCVLSCLLIGKMASYGASFTFMMGHFPAPWGNEIRAGMLEAVCALAFALIMLLSVLGGMKKAQSQIAEDKQNLYYIMLELLTAALMAQVYTNDLFTAYVFLEIMTIAACSLIASRTIGRTLVAATRYMVLNLLGSGLYLLGLTMLYDLTGHLLMSNIQQQVQLLFATGEYHQPLTVVVALITIGLAIKSALFPFHTWVPDAYSYTTPTSSAVLSSLVSKGYIFLLIKIFYRVFGLNVILASRIDDVLFIFALMGMVMGSLSAIKQNDIRRMISFSSVAQIGYIYMGIGMGNEAGMVAAIFHIFAHSFSKSMLFLAGSGLSDASGDLKDFKSLRGAGYRHPLAGAAFCVGAFSMVGIPFLSGFVSKVYFATAAMGMNQIPMLMVMGVLAVSTALNTVYFLKTVITLYRPSADPALFKAGIYHSGVLYSGALVVWMAVTVALGVFSQPVVAAIRQGLHLFM